MSNKFWVGYMLFFIFPFPMIFEYVPMMFADEDGFVMLSSPWMAIFYLFLGAALWFTLISAYHRLFVKPQKKKYRNMRTILSTGLPVTAHVERKIIETEARGTQVLDLQISFKNLRDTLVVVPFVIHDTQPALQRYEVGEFIKMKVDPELKAPVMLAEDLDLNKKKVMQGYFVSFLGLMAFCFFYLIFSYWLQNGGTGWRFLHFWHPWVTIPFWGLVLGWVLMFLPLGDSYGGLDPRAQKDSLLLFNGLFAKGEILEADNTGLSINDQPEIKFTLEYMDQSGELHIVRLKKIVRLINLHRLGQEHINILYDPDDPSKVLLGDDYRPKNSIEDWI